MLQPLAVVCFAALSLAASLGFFCIFSDVSIHRYALSFAVSTAVVYWSLKRKSLDVGGAAWAFVVGFILTFANVTFCVTMLTFFVTSSRLTKWRSSSKGKLSEEEGKASRSVGRFINRYHRY